MIGIVLVWWLGAFLASPSLAQVGPREIANSVSRILDGRTVDPDSIVDIYERLGSAFYYQPSEIPRRRSLLFLPREVKRKPESPHEFPVYLNGRPFRGIHTPKEPPENESADLTDRKLYRFGLSHDTTYEFRQQALHWRRAIYQKFNNAQASKVLSALQKEHTRNLRHAPDGRLPAFSRAFDEAELLAIVAHAPAGQRLAARWSHYYLEAGDCESIVLLGKLMSRWGQMPASLKMSTAVCAYIFHKAHPTVVTSEMIDWVSRIDETSLLEKYPDPFNPQIVASLQWLRSHPKAALRNRVPLKAAAPKNPEGYIAISNELLAHGQRYQVYRTANTKDKNGYLVISAADGKVEREIVIPFAADTDKKGSTLLLRDDQIELVSVSLFLNLEGGSFAFGHYREDNSSSITIKVGVRSFSLQGVPVRGPVPDVVAGLVSENMDRVVVRPLIDQAIEDFIGTGMTAAIKVLRDFGPLARNQVVKKNAARFFRPAAVWRLSLYVEISRSAAGLPQSENRCGIQEDFRLPSESLLR